MRPKKLRRTTRPAFGFEGRPREAISKATSGRSLAEFLPLSRAEQRLLEACRLGVEARLGNQAPTITNDELRIRSSFLRFILLGGDGAAPVHERGVWLTGAFLEGPLDLDGSIVPHDMALVNCLFSDHLSARNARIQGSLALQGSRLTQGFDGIRLQCEGNLQLADGFMAIGPVRLHGSKIAGDLICRGGHFRVEAGEALTLDGANVKGCVFFDYGFTSIGSVHLIGAEIGASLTCPGAQFKTIDGKALSMDGATIKGSIQLTRGFRASGAVRLIGTRIGGSLECGGGQFDVSESVALSADRAIIDGDVFLNDGFQATGEVRFNGSQIAGDVVCTRGRFVAPKGTSLSFERSTVNGRLILNDQFIAKGKVQLDNTNIGNDLLCRGGIFSGEEGVAISLDRSIVSGSIFFDQGFTAAGLIRLINTYIGNNLECSGGTIAARNGIAIDSYRTNVNGSIILDGGFKAIGSIKLIGAQIGGDFSCRDSHFEATNSHALVASGTIIKGSWLFDRLKTPASVNADHLQVEVLVDSIESWAPGSILDGMRYSALGEQAPTRASIRLEWLEKQSASSLGETDEGNNFRPQPWRQLQNVLREMGHAEDARQIGIAYENRIRKVGLIGRSSPQAHKITAFLNRHVSRIGHVIFGLLAGYGYKPMQLIFSMFAAWLICGAIYWILALPPSSAIGPSDPLIFQNTEYSTCQPGNKKAVLAATQGDKNAGNWYLCKDLPSEYSTFSPLIYSLDIMLPLVDLGQEKAWGALIPTPKQHFWNELTSISSAHVVRWLVWFETLFGWVSNLLLVGIVSGFSRRTED